VEAEDDWLEVTLVWLLAAAEPALEVLTEEKNPAFE